MSEVWVEGPRGKLYVRDERGGGLPVLFLHSDGGNGTHWTEQLDCLRPARRAIAIDLRGHGQSEAPRDGDYSVEGRAEDVASVAAALGLNRFVLVGHSGGGAVALAYAGTHPQRVARLLLVDTATDGRQIPADVVREFIERLRSGEYEKAVRDYFGPLAGPNAEAAGRVLADIWATPKEAIIGTFLALAEFDPTGPLLTYRGPRLSLVTPPNDNPAGHHRLDPSLPHRLVEGTGHWLHLDDPAAFGKTLDEFLGTVSVAR